MPPLVMQTVTGREPQPPAGATLKHFTGSAYVSDTPPAGPSEEASGTPEQPGAKLPDLVSEEENAKMQVCWNRAMCQEMQIPEGYQNISVLIIKWAKEIDQLDSAHEVEQVRQVFSVDFNYPTKVIELNNTTRPQLQLDREVINFVSEFNGLHNLLIVYYSGHGSFDDDKGELSLHV